jgi:organic hydroperoxide reductase OsmC/OhrA
MSIHTAEVQWTRGEQRFTDNRYSRVHNWRFDGGVVVPASSSPAAVRVPFSDPANVDPEEAFVASLSSCHMLWFLALAARDGYTVDSYTDSAAGTLSRNAAGKEAITAVLLHPMLVFSGEKVPDDAAVSQLHHAAHESCFLANSVTSDISINGSWRHLGQAAR